MKWCLCVDGLCNTQNLIWKTRRVERNHRPVRRLQCDSLFIISMKNHEKNDYTHTHSLRRTTFNEKQNYYLHTKRIYGSASRLHSVLWYVKNSVMATVGVGIQRFGEHKEWTGRKFSSELWLKFIRICYLRMGNQFSISQTDKQYLISLTLKLFAAICSNSRRQWFCKADTDTPDFECQKQQWPCHSTGIVTSTNKSIVSN